MKLPHWRIVMVAASCVVAVVAIASLLVQFDSKGPDTAVASTTESIPEGEKPFGRHGALTAHELAMATVAWSYFVERFQPDTGMVNAVGAFASTTLWDQASYLSGLVSARELGLIDKQEFDRRAMLFIKTMRNLDLFQGELPNKVYDTKTAGKVDYANKPGEIGYSALDIGRLLVWFEIIKQRYPYLASSIDSVVLRWNFCNVIGQDGNLFGSFVSGNKEVRYVQEGRLGYEQYAAKGFQLWGFNADGAASPVPYEFTPIYGVQIPVDGRDPRVFKNKNYVLTESYLLDGLEMNWDLAGDKSSGPGTASMGWRAEFANRIYLVQQRRFEETGILTARSEHQVDGAPYFVYDSIFSDGYAWNTLDPTGVYQPDRAAVSAKAALGMWALWDTPYTDLLFEAVSDLSVPGSGFDEGLYENGNGVIPTLTANNNGIILAALLYKVQGPILQYHNQNTQLWDTAYPNSDRRRKQCLPPAKVDPTTASATAPAPVATPAVPVDQFQLCRPIVTKTGVAAIHRNLNPVNRRELIGDRRSCAIRVKSP